MDATDTELNWKQGGEAYLPALNAAEDQYAIPADLLARVAYQESHWRADIVNCTLISPAGAVGLMQLEPKFFPGAGQDWRMDVNTAAHELARLYGVFKSWRLAVMAYNWGQRNVQKYQDGKITKMPQETSDYVTEVFFDVPVTGPLNA